MKLLPFRKENALTEPEINAINKATNNFKLFNLNCPLSNSHSSPVDCSYHGCTGCNRPEDCTFDGYRCKGCSTMKTVISQEVATLVQLAKWTGEKRYIKEAKVFFSLRDTFRKGVAKDSLK